MDGTESEERKKRKEKEGRKGKNERDGKEKENNGVRERGKQQRDCRYRSLDVL